VAVRIPARAVIDTSEVDRLVAKLASNSLKAPLFAKAAVRTAGLRGLGLVKRNASGRPGPRVRTGDYRRAMNLRFEDEGFTASIGNNSPQAQRLEEGFVGADALGRVYDQPPFPHFRPMAEQLRGEWDGIMSAVVRDALRKDGLR
jgi:hypothetical protein